MKKVSIIVPVYNMEKYLRQCMDSLVMQTLEDIEIIAVDDGSKDQSLAILKEYESKYGDKVKIIAKSNGGQGSARNLALHSVEGEYISFVDSDDWIDLKTYETAYKKAVESNADIVFWDLEWVYEDGTKTLHNTFSKVDNTLNPASYMFSDPSPCNKMIKSSIFLKNKVRFPENCWYEDIAVIPSLVKYIHKMEYIHEPFYKYRQRSNSTMQQLSYNPKFMDIIIAMNYLRVQMEQSEYTKEMEYLYIFQVLYFASFRFMQYEKYEDIKTCLKELNTYYPDWKNNSYYKAKPKVFKIYCELLANEHYKLADLLIKIRKMISKS